MPLQLPLEINKSDFKDRLLDVPRKSVNKGKTFTGQELAQLFKDYYGEDKDLELKWVEEGWWFLAPKGSEKVWLKADDVYEMLICNGKIKHPNRGGGDTKAARIQKQL